MKWYWKVRLYRDDGHYYFANIETDRNLKEIETVQRFYYTMTGCNMLIEGMSEQPSGCPSIDSAFTACWRK